MFTRQLSSTCVSCSYPLAQPPTSPSGGVTLDYERLDRMKIFESQSGLTRSPICLHHEGSSNVTTAIDKTNINQHQMYPSIRKAMEAGFITSDFDMDSHYRARRLQLTEKGNYIAKRLDEISISLTGKYVDSV